MEPTQRFLDRARLKTDQIVGLLLQKAKIRPIGKLVMGVLRASVDPQNRLHKGSDAGAAVPSIWHRLRKRRHDGIVRSHAVTTTIGAIILL
jgi:hypothetical protein